MAKANINVAGTAYFVVLPNLSPAPSSAQVKAGQDASSGSLASNLKGTITCTNASTEYTAAVSGLNASTTYDVYFVAEASALLQASPTMVSVSTTSSASAPTISSPTASGIINNSALLGGNITSDGGDGITARGTVWKTSSPVLITDNVLAEGGTSTGTFSHSRSSLPAKTLIYYAAYATNNIGTTLSSESSFYTLADEPASHVGSFAAVAASSTAINLTWTAATGADGYLILQKQGSSAPTGTPSDATGYTAGNTISDATVAFEVLSGSTTSQTISSLTGGTQYYFTIIPYAYDGLNYQTYNYNTTATIPSATATTQEATIQWDGGASTTAWADANNWSGNIVPSTNDIVVLDNSIVGGSYTVNLPTGNVKTTIKRLTITPTGSNNITLTLPVGNTYGATDDAGFVVGDNAAVNR